MDEAREQELRRRQMEEAQRQSRDDAARAGAARRAQQESMIRENPNLQKGEEFDRVRVFFATDRAAGEEEGVFTAQRGAGGLHYGSVDVSIPRTHKPGEIERPPIWQLELEDPRDHMVVVQRAVTDRERFFADIRDTLRRGGSKASFVFVPGFNVGFDDAARRAAQITFDLDFPGAPVFYSWPSQARDDAYADDERNAEWSRPHLRAFLADYAARSGAQDIYLIAHSLGARILAAALADLFTEQPLLRSRFKEVILTAPDIDADTFKSDIAPKLVTGTGKVTLYVSSIDQALRAAHAATGRTTVGDAAEQIAVIPGVETIDASAVDTSLVERAYAGPLTVLSDIRRVVVDGVRAVDRGLQEYEASGGRFWRLDATSGPRTERRRASGVRLLAAVMAGPAFGADRLAPFVPGSFRPPSS